MSAARVQGPSKAADAERERERDCVLGALGTDPISGWEVARRLDERGVRGETDGHTGGETGGADTEALLYSSLHGLEAAGQVRAEWLRSRDGRLRRRYWRPRRGWLLTLRRLDPRRG